MWICSADLFPQELYRQAARNCYLNQGLKPLDTIGALLRPLYPLKTPVYTSRYHHTEEFKGGAGPLLYQEALAKKKKTCDCSGGAKRYFRERFLRPFHTIFLQISHFTEHDCKNYAGQLSERQACLSIVNRGLSWNHLNITELWYRVV